MRTGLACAGMDGATRISTGTRKTFRQEARRGAMNKSADSASAANPLAHGVPRQPAYSQDARSYDHRTSAFQAYRQAIVGALPLRRGQAVLDVGCGTGLCYGFLVEKVDRGAVSSASRSHPRWRQ
jgi:hypothetical protein